MARFVPPKSSLALLLPKCLSNACGSTSRSLLKRSEKVRAHCKSMYGAGKTRCIALLAAWRAVALCLCPLCCQGKYTVRVMAEFVHHLLPRGIDRPSASSNGNDTIWRARLILTTRACTWLSFGTTIVPSPSLLTMQSFSSSTTRPNKKPQSAMLNL